MGTSFEAGEQFAEAVVMNNDKVEINRFGPVWAGIDELRDGLSDLDGGLIEVDFIKDCLNFIVEQFPEGFVDSVKAFEDRHKK